MRIGRRNKGLIKSIFFYSIFAAVFIIGYILGLLQRSYLCNGNVQGIKTLQEKKDATKDSVFLIVIIFSSPGNHERRQVIRETWLLTKRNYSILHIFVIGSASLNNEELHALQNEHDEYSDLLLLRSVQDSFTKLSEKLREVFRWLDINMHYTFLLKVDDDSFVRLDALYNKMIKQPQEKLYWGYFDGQASVKTKGKWKEENWFLCDRYLPYAKGGGYVLSEDLVHYIVDVSDYLTLYHNEDVSLGTWLSPFEIKRLHDPLFDTEFLSRGCFNSYLVTHKQSTFMMIEKYKSIESSGKLCISEHRIRNFYSYNWNVPPSQCCTRNESQIP